MQICRQPERRLMGTASPSPISFLFREMKQILFQKLKTRTKMSAQTLELWSRLRRRSRAIFGLAGTTTCGCYVQFLQRGCSSSWIRLYHHGWPVCYCFIPNGGESFDMYVKNYEAFQKGLRYLVKNFKYCALHVCPSCSVFRGIMHPCMICNSTLLFISRVHVHNAHF